MSDDDRIATVERQVADVSAALRAVVDLVDRLQTELADSPTTPGLRHITWGGDVRELRVLVDRLPK